MSKICYFGIFVHEGYERKVAKILEELKIDYSMKYADFSVGGHKIIRAYFDGSEHEERIEQMKQRLDKFKGRVNLKAMYKGKELT